MNQQFRYRQFPAGNPLANVLVVIVGIVVISLSLALGFFMFLGIAGFVLVMAAIVSIRNWWQRRRFGTTAETGQPREPSQAHQPRIIEGEYQQVGEQNQRNDNDGQP